jgi:hypothetical protein
MRFCLFFCGFALVFVQADRLVSLKQIVCRVFSRFPRSIAFYVHGLLTATTLVVFFSLLTEANGHSMKTMSSPPGMFDVRINKLYDSSYSLVEAVLTATWFLVLVGTISEFYEGPVYILLKSGANISIGRTKLIA